MKRTYRIFSLLLSLALAISLLPQVVLPASADASGSCGEEGNDLRWTFEAATGTLTIQGSGYMAHVFENDESPWYDCRDQIRTLVLPEGLLNVGKKAFFGCSALTSVTVPDSVEIIGEEAFRECAALTGVTLGNGYYYTAMLWAVENGITTGATRTTFAPDKTCTRGQVVTFLWRCFTGK